MTHQLFMSSDETLVPRAPFTDEELLQGDLERLRSQQADPHRQRAAEAATARENDLRRKMSGGLL